MEHPSCTIDGFGPIPVQRPNTIAELSELVRRAAAEGQATYPLGGRTMLDLGLPPTRPGVGLDLRGLTQVVDYPARDMTITVEAGITLASLQDRLRAENQRLPVDVPRAAEATLGGALAANVSGPRRLGFGTLRDYVIGIHVVNDEGHEVKAGGRVVKNVAGYDLCKLHVGALGTLGVISQVTLKLRPLPDDQAICLVAASAESVDALLDKLHGSQVRPVAIELLNAAAVRKLNEPRPLFAAESAWLLVVGFEDTPDAVTWQVERLTEEFPGVSVRRGPESVPHWEALAEFSLRPEAGLTFKANVLPHAVGAFCRKAATLSDRLLLQAHAGNGIVIGHVDGDWAVEQAGPLLQTLRDEAVAARGNLVVRRCPPEWKPTLPVWGAPRGDVWLMKKVKEKLDPKQIFNPGRFLWSNPLPTATTLPASVEA